MKTTAVKLSVLVGACTLAACSTVTVTTDYDHSASFGKYKTYAIAPYIHEPQLSATSAAALRDTLRTELGARGLTEVTHKPDLAIVDHVFIQTNVTVQQYHDWGYNHPGSWPYGYGYYGGWSGAPTTYFDVHAYNQGTLVLDAVDMHTMKLVFRGVGAAIVEGSEDNAEKIREAVKKMVDALPK